MVKTQQIRVKNLLLNHAPGATLETIDGPVVVRTFDSIKGTLSNVHGKEFPSYFEIYEKRLSDQMPMPSDAEDKPRLHRIPSNAEIGRPESNHIIDTKSFPRWKLCTNPPEHEDGVLFDSWGQKKCPRCENDNSSAIRFVQYCEKGHLDDLDWSYRLHGSRECKPDYLVWSERDSSRRGVTVSCPKCKKSASLSDISNSHTKCFGRRPEKERDGESLLYEDCDSPTKVTLRQSTVLWQSITQSVISTPQDDPLETLTFKFYGRRIGHGKTVDQTFGGISPCEETLQELFDESTMTGIQRPDDPDLQRILTHIYGEKRMDIPRSQWPTLVQLCMRVAKSGLSEFKRVWDALSSSENKSATRESYKAEFKAMMDHDNLPKEMVDPSTGRCIFKMEESHVEASLGNIDLVIRPISVLRSVTALIGYTRGAIDPDSDTAPTMVSLSHNTNMTPWYAAAESMGEGILIHFKGDSRITKGQRWEKWIESHEKVTSASLLEDPAETISWNLFRSASSARRIDEDWSPPPTPASEYFAEAHPTFVWWHTLAHHMIRAIQAETGYSSSAIRERVYASPDADGNWSGAIVLSVTDGTDGTLGGLVSLLPNIQTFVDKVSMTATTCSNDPLCKESPQMGEIHQIGCYACTLNPETSCEHRNMFLDRLLLIEGAGLG